jgi:glycerophosphoryl diester phosphodiesterase
VVLAHRGANGVEPENTLAAFRRALELGADGVELDVHRTADGGLVVHHDAAAPGVGLLADLTTDAVRASAPQIPTLAEALDVCAGRIVNVEVKNLPGDADFDPADRAAGLLVELLAARGHNDGVLVSSFNLATVDRVHALDDRIPTALLTARTTDLAGLLHVAHDHGHRALNPRAHSLGGRRAARLAERARALELALYVWTVNEPSQMRRLADAGVDGLITDAPDLAFETLRGRTSSRATSPR